MDFGTSRKSYNFFFFFYYHFSQAQKKERMKYHADIIVHSISYLFLLLYFNQAQY